MSEFHSPPKLAFWLLRIFCRADYRDEVAGDLQEMYEWRLKNTKSTVANYRYLLDTLSAIRFYRGGKAGASISKSMLLSFVKSSFRNFKRHFGYTSLNVAGLAIGLAAALFILEYVSEELNYNNSSQADQLYRVSNNYYRFGGMIYESSMTFSGVGPAMVNDFPEVLDQARLYSPNEFRGDVVITLPNQPNIRFKEQKLFFSDPNYLPFFDLEITSGTNDLDKQNTVLLTTEMAEKYFGSIEQAIGSTLRYDDSQDGFNLIVTGIFKKPQFKLQLDTDILISYATIAQTNPDSFVNDWGGNAFMTFIKVTEQADPRAIESTMSQLTLRYKPSYAEKNDSGEYNRINSYFLESVTDIHLNSDYQNEIGPIGNVVTIRVLQIIALFIVVMAWINFINLSTAKSVDRALEVGVRKVMGAGKNELTAQFFIEAVLINLMAVCMAIIIVLIAQPAFDSFVEKELSLKSIDLNRFGLISVLIFSLGTMLSGIYPALILSSHKILNALKGKSKVGSNQPLRRGLIVFQLFFSSLLIIATLAINEQLKFMENQNMGFEIENLLVLKGPVVRPLENEERISNIQSFKQEVLSIAGVDNIGTSTVIPGLGILRGNAISRIHESEDFKSIERVVSSNQYLSTIGSEFLIGKDFDESMEGYRPIILNESAVKELEFSSVEDALGQVVYEGTRNEMRIVGVIKDYHHESLNMAIDPMYFTRNEGYDNYYVIRLNTGQTAAALNQIESVYQSSFPNNPVDYYFLEDYFSRQYRRDEVNRKVFTAFAVLAIIVACLGLYGLSSFSALQRTKEVGVRKVLGANIPKLFALLSKEVFTLVFIGFLVSLPLAWLGVDNWLNGFAYRMPINAFLFVVPMVLVGLITLLATGVRILKVTLANPIDSLRYE